MEAKFTKIEKLKSKKEIESLFSEGKSIMSYPIRLCYRISKFEEPILCKTAVSVSKRHFKNATDRNYIKRLLRESYRKNKYLVTNTTHQFTFMFLYSGNKKPDYALVSTKVKEILQQVVKKELGQ